MSGAQNQEEKFTPVLVYSPPKMTYKQKTSDKKRKWQFSIASTNSLLLDDE